MPQERNYTLDIAKGICIILMVIGHSGPPKYVHDFIYMFHMPCFFIISGMLFKEKYLTDIRRFLIRKGKSLWKPFVVWTLVFLVLHNLFAQINLYNEEYTWRELIKYAVHGIFMRKTEPLLGGFWFLTSLLFASILSLVWYRLFGMSKESLMLGIILTLVVSLLLLTYSLNFAYFTYTNFLAASFFMTGTLICHVKFKSLTTKSILILASMLICATVALYMPCNMLKIHPYQIIGYYITSTATSWSLIIICTLMTPKQPIQWIIKVGERTLDILIFHFLALKLISVIKIIHYDMAWSKLSDFPVIVEHNQYYWIMYSILGIVFSLIIAEVIHFSIQICLKTYRKIIQC